MKAQAFPEHSLRTEAEPAKAAVPPTWRHIQALEAAIVSGATAQERVMAGFFVFLIHTSHRSANGQTTRKLKLTEEALLGESLVKGQFVVETVGLRARRNVSGRLGGPMVGGDGQERHAW